MPPVLIKTLPLKSRRVKGKLVFSSPKLSVDYYDVSKIPDIKKHLVELGIQKALAKKRKKISSEALSQRY